MRNSAWAFFGCGVLVAACNGDVSSGGSSDGSSSDSSSSNASSTSGSAQPGKIGDKCVVDADCASGICLDISDFDDGCLGRLCTQPCSSKSDCPQVAEQEDCESFGAGPEVCVYGGWEPLLCPK